MWQALQDHSKSNSKILDTWDWNESTSGQTPWQIYVDDDDDDPGTLNVTGSTGSLKIQF